MVHRTDVSVVLLFDICRSSGLQAAFENLAYTTRIPLGQGT